MTPPHPTPTPPKPPPSGDTSPRSRSQLPRPDTCKRPLFSLSPSSPQPWLRLMEPGQLQQWGRGWGAQQLDGGRALPRLGRVPAGAGEEGEARVSSARFSLQAGGMRARDSILTLLHNSSWSFRGRQVSVASIESKATKGQGYMSKTLRDLALSHILHPQQPSHSPANSRSWRTKPGPLPPDKKIWQYRSLAM